MAMDEDWGSGWDSGSSFNQGADTTYSQFTDWGSPDPSSYQDPYAGAGGQYGPAATGSVAQDVLQAGGTLNAQGVPQGQGSWWDQLMASNQGAGIPQPASAMNIGAPGAQGFGGMGLQGLLGLGGAGAGLLGALMSGGVTGSQKPILGTNQKAAINQAGTQMQPFIQGSSPLQMQQQQLLTALANGQIPPEMANLVARAYDPQYQQAATRATEAGRQAGFYDAPMSSPVGGAIMGPAAAQLQGQQANSLLGLMQTMPGLYNTPISQQIGAAGTQGGNLLQGAQLGTGQQTSKPLGAQIGQGVGGALQGASQAIGQNNFATQLGRFMQGQGGITLSGNQSNG